MRVWGMHELTNIQLSRTDRSQLKAVVANRNSPQKHVWRAKIVLLTADGRGTAIWYRPGGGRHRRAAQQRTRRFHRGARRVERLWPRGIRGQPARPRQTPIVLDVA